MDWTEKSEHKKKLRKMARRMLWADSKDFVLGWKVLLLALMWLGFFFLPYKKNLEDFNSGAMYYFVMWVFMALNALSEKSFNYLPLSTKDIVYYLKYRTNLLAAWLMSASLGTALILQVCGVEVFMERGLAVLIFLLITLEWILFMTLYGYSKPLGINFLDDSIPVARKVRIAIYNVYSIGMLFVGMFVALFMEFDENSEKKLLFLVCAYAVMFIFRADAARWVRFEEYTNISRKSMFVSAEAREMAATK